jgi:hypothetical protein
VRRGKKAEGADFDQDNEGEAEGSRRQFSWWFAHDIL